MELDFDFDDDAERFDLRELDFAEECFEARDRADLEDLALAFEHLMRLLLALAERPRAQRTGLGRVQPA